MKIRIWYSLLLLFICFGPTRAYSALSMEVNPNPVRQAERLNVVLTVANSSSTVMTNVELLVRYPEHLNRLSTSFITTGGSANTVACMGGSLTGYCDSGEIVTWNLGNLPPGDGVTVSMQPTVYSLTEDETDITFEAEVRIDGIQHELQSRTVQVLKDPFFELTVDKETDPVISGDMHEYTISFSNISTSSANTELTFPIPSGGTFVSATGGGTLISGEVVWDLGSLAGGRVGERGVSISVASGEGNLLTVDSTRLNGIDSGFYSHQVQNVDVSRIESSVRPNLAMTLNPDPVRPSGTLNVAMTVTNPGFDMMSNVQVLLRYPDHLDRLDTSFITTSGSANTVACMGGSLTSYCDAGEIVTWNLGNLPPGGAVTVTMPPRVSSSSSVADATLIPFEAEVRVDGVQRALTSRTAQVLVDPFFELAVDGEKNPVTSSGNREYTLTYSNVATRSAETTLIFPIPPDTRFVSSTGGGSLSSGEVVWNLGSVMSGTGGERRVTVEVDASEGDMLKVNTAQLRGRDSSFIDHQVQAGNITSVEIESLPLLTMDLDPVPVGPSTTLDVELTVENPGSAMLSNVELLLRYPEHLNRLDTSLITTGGSANTVVCMGGSLTSYCDAREIVTWNLGNLPPGGGVTVTMPPIVSSSTASGTLIPFEAELRVDGGQQVLLSKTVFVGTVYDTGGPEDPPDDPPDDPPGDNNGICFPVKAISGAITIICM